MKERTLTREQVEQMLKLDRFLNERVKYIANLNPDPIVTEVQVGLQLSAILAGNFLIGFPLAHAERLLLDNFTRKALSMRKVFLEEFKTQELRRKLKALKK